uniref:Uncharacterized protein n=1 Tax=Setaria italica TaxID=4555 RepID=K4APG7_SETIT
MEEPQQNICARHGNDWVGMAARGGGPIGGVVTSDGVQVHLLRSYIPYV